mmetsp:Transcript_28350/g.72820  ORF Transcript_28350/g.72820 Transcript_28350/m.72820 type:complete len:267 (-) Transcript_28350:1548-2348(-)
MRNLHAVQLVAPLTLLVHVTADLSQGLGLGCVFLKAPSPAKVVDLPVVLKNLDVLLCILVCLCNVGIYVAPHILEHLGGANDRGWVETRGLAIKVGRKCTHEDNPGCLLRHADNAFQGHIQLLKHRLAIGRELDAICRKRNSGEEDALGLLVASAFVWNQHGQSLVRAVSDALDHALHKQIVRKPDEPPQHGQLFHDARKVLGALQLFALDSDHGAPPASSASLHQLNAICVVQLSLVPHTLLVQLCLLLHVSAHMLQHMLDLLHD